MRVEAKLKKDRKTKKLAKRIEPGQILSLIHI